MHPASVPTQPSAASDADTHTAARFAVLMVCMGNICRSPTAHGVLRKMVATKGWGQWLQVDSCGTHAHHVGEPPDARSQKHAQRRGYQFADLRARQLSAQDFAQHDLVLVMDHDNLARARALCPPEHQHKIRRLTEFCTLMHSAVVPDPYYGGDQGFEHVLDLIEDACHGVLAYVAKTHLGTR